MTQDDWMKYLPTVGVAVGLLGLVALGIQNAMLASQVETLSGEVTALHKLVALEAGADGPAATAMRRMPRTPPPSARAPGAGRRPGPPGTAPGAPGGLPRGGRRGPPAEAPAPEEP